MINPSLLLIRSLTLASMDSIGDKIIGWFTDIGDAIVRMLKAPFVAVADILGGWASTIGSTWYAPIIMSVVLIVTLIVIYFGFSAIEKLPGQ